MIFLTKLDGKQFMLNEQLIEVVNETPDTVIVLSNGHSYIVRESMRELNNKIIEYNRLRRRAALKGRAGKDESLTIEQISNSMKSEG
jgi:flagellar protein FlbD